MLKAEASYWLREQVLDALSRAQVESDVSNFFILLESKTPLVDITTGLTAIDAAALEFTVIGCVHLYLYPCHSCGVQQLLADSLERSKQCCCYS